MPVKKLEDYTKIIYEYVTIKIRWFEYNKNRRK